MMGRRVSLLDVLVALMVAATLSSFTLVLGDPSSQADSKETATQEANSQEDSKEKRSQEEILFGNQQNKPNGLVDDVMGMAEDQKEEPLALPLKKANDSQGEAAEKRGEEGESGDVEMGAESWFGAPPPAQPAGMHYNIDSMQEQYEPEEGEYRRKRSLWQHRSQLRKRSLRSSLGQMLKRSARLPRRSLRLKRQADVEELISLFGAPPYEHQPQMTPHIFGGRARMVAKRRVPGRFGGYPDHPYPYLFQHRENDESQDDDDKLEDVDDLMLLPPGSRYVDTHDPRLLTPYRSQEEENDAIQKWLSRNTTPSVFRVQRRASPFFYPIDYRYIPGLKKRSSFRNRGGAWGGGGEEEGEEAGRWGHVVQVPEAYASAEDVARLYGLASLMAEGDEQQPDVRRRDAP